MSAKIQPEGSRDAQANAADRVPPTVACGLLQGFRRIKNLLGRPNERAPVIGECDGVRAPMDETHAELLLERGDLTGNRWLRNAQFRGHCGKRAGFGNPKERAKCSDQIHGSYQRYQAL